jgi:hypothetical protein
MSRACRQLTRLLALKRLLDGCVYRPSLECLANQLRVTPRTIRRDLAVLSEAGECVPIARPLVSDDAAVLKAHRRYGQSPLRHHVSRR